MTQKIKFERLITCSSGLVVKVVALSLVRRSSDANYQDDFGELLVHYDPGYWDAEPPGPLAPDPTFLERLKGELAESLFDGSDLQYSARQAMTGGPISLVAGPNFIFSWEIHTESLKTSAAEENRKRLIVMSRLGFPKAAVRAQLNEYIKSCFASPDERDVSQLMFSIQNGKEIWDDPK